MPSPRSVAAGLLVTRPVVTWCVGFTLIGFAGCGSGSGAINTGPTGVNDPVPAESVSRYSAPSSRSSQLVSKLNLRREQTYSSTAYAVNHSDVLYTAALRHAINLNTVNSYNATGRSNGLDMQFIRPDSLLDVLASDYTWITISTSNTTIGAESRPFPALFTSVDLWERIQAVRGGPSLLRSRSETSAREFYTFSGNVWTGSGVQTQFRGYNEDNVVDKFDAIDNVWYTTPGRIGLMRASLAAVGYARKDDSYAGNVITPPFPILYNRFTGVLDAIYRLPFVSQLGYWPNNGNVDVIPYGLDTVIGGSTGYAGPPIHFTLPVAEPILTSSGNLAITIEKINPRTRISGQKQLRIFSSQAGLTVDLPSTTGPDADYRYTGTTGRATLVDNGKITLIDQNAVVPNGYSVIQFDSNVSLADVRPGDTVLLSYPEDPTTAETEDALLSGIYVVLANKDRRDYGTILDPQYGEVQLPYSINSISMDGLPSHSLAVSYIGGASETFAGSGVFYPTQDPQVSFFLTNNYPYDWFERPNRPGASASIESSSLTRSAVENSPGLGMRDGEFIIVPTDPMDPLTTYRVTVRARTVSQSYDFSFVFTTNGRTAPTR